MLPMHVTYLRGENGETSESDDSVISVKGHKRDDRLFPDIPLYCEGYPKPIARGVLHLLCTMLLPFGLRYLIKIAGPNNRIAHIASALYIFTNIWCYGFSALYHVGRWSVQMEILMQKLDHCGVALLSTGTMIPACMLLLPFEIGCCFGLLSASCSLWTCYHIYVLSQPSVVRQVIVPGCILIFFPWLFTAMNILEISLVLGTIAAQVIGLAVFLNEWPSPCPKVFGHHEIFHIFVVLAGMCVYICNISIVRRSAGMDPLQFHFLNFKESFILLDIFSQ